MRDDGSGVYVDSDRVGGRRWRACSIPGIGHRDEYVMLSAQFDSWDGSSGATDNGIGTRTMLEGTRAAELTDLRSPASKVTWDLYARMARG